MTATATATRAEARFNSALATLTQRGTRVRTNAETCCRSCVTEESIHVDGQPAHLWTFEQEGTFSWVNGRPVVVTLIDIDEVCYCSDEEIDYDEDTDEEVTVSEAFTCHHCEAGQDELIEHSRVSSLHFYYDHDNIDHARTAQVVFTSEGFTVNWNGTCWDSVEVVLKDTE